MMTELANHLWQSTVFAIAAGLLTLLLRKNHASTRYWLWFAASVKFLVPFSLLLAAGNALPWPTSTTVVQPAVAVFFEDVSEPFNAIPLTAMQPGTQATSLINVALPLIWFCGSAAVLCFWFVRSRRLKRTLRESMPLQSGREFEAVRRLQNNDVSLAASKTALEPGAVGIFRPILVLPAGISHRLDERQLEAILMHELAHVRRRDNLFAAIHMLVESLFWFHPLVWWLGARLIDERERACDEEVMRHGHEPQSYAEGILKVCEFYLASPLACAAGVTGADLKKRIETIMSSRIATNLSFAKKAFLATAAVAVAAGPIVIGAMNSQTIVTQAPAQGVPAPGPKPSFEVVSIKPGSPVLTRIRIEIQGNRFLAENFNLKMLVGRAYNVPEARIIGGPDWLESARFHVEAKAEGLAIPPGQLGPMIQSMLEDRFQLKAHRETRELPIYELVVARGGPKIKLAEDQSPLPTLNQMSPEQLAKMQAAMRGGGPMPPPERGSFNRGMGQYTGTAVRMSVLVNSLTQQLGRPVIDKTGLSALYDVSLKWTPGAEQAPGPFGPPPGGVPPGVDPDGPSIFTALQEQLGLRLDSTKGPVEVIVIDSAQKPTEN